MPAVCIGVIVNTQPFVTVHFVDISLKGLFFFRHPLQDEGDNERNILGVELNCF